VLTTPEAAPPLPGDVRLLGLTPLSGEDARAGAAATLQRTGSADADLVAYCARSANGDPLAMDLIARHVEHLRELDTEESARSSEARERTTHPTTSVPHLVGRVVQRLDDVARLLLELVAVVEAPVPVDVLERATGSGRHRFRQSAALLGVLHLTRRREAAGGAVIEPYHERVRSAVLALLDESRRAELHRLLALEFEASEVSDPYALATHWGRAGDAKQMGHYAARAADEAGERMAFANASRWYESALSSPWWSDDERRSLLVKLGEARANAGLGRDASAFAQAADRANRTTELDLRRRAAEELLMIGDIDAGTSELRDVAARVGIWMPKSALTARVATLLFRTALWVRGMGFELRDEEAMSAAEVTRFWVCAGVARALSRFNSFLATYFQARMLLLALRGGSAYELSYALAFEAAFVAAGGVRTRARTDKLLAQAEALARRSGVPRAMATAQNSRGYVAYMQGRAMEGIETLESSIEVALDQATSGISALRHMQLNLLMTRANIGDLEEVSVQLRSVLREAVDRGDLATSTAVRVLPYLWRGWLRDGDPQEVRAGIEDVTSRWSHGGYLSQHHWAIGALAEVDLYEGRGREAFERVARDFPQARRARRFAVERVHIVARERRARSAIMAAAQEMRPRERSRLLAVAARDASWLRRAPPDFARARAAVVDAGIASVQGERARAVAALEQAITRLEGADDRFAAACARIRLGLLLGSECSAGRTMLAVGEEFMRAQGVADSRRLAASVVPGIAV